jgi:pimeloyl-ACP methyl ester carboxylesterase
LALLNVVPGADAPAMQPRHLARRIAGIVGVLAALGMAAYLVGFAGYGIVVGADEYLAGAPRLTSCDTPGSRFGWTYAAVNYPIADDAVLLAANPDHGNCASQGAGAGTDVVAPDGTHLAGWYIPVATSTGTATDTDPTVVLVHGGKSNKSGMLDYAPAFHDRYNLLIVDLRNSGRSGGTQSTGGLREQGDLRAFIEWLVRTKHPTWIAVMGNSNGAATALAEARDDTEVRALILDSMHATLESQLGTVIESEKHLPAWPGAWGVMVGVQLRLGEPVESVDPVLTITQVGNRPILLTHGSADVIDRPAQSLDRNVAAAGAAGADVEVHVCQGAGHGMVVTVCAADWTAWVQQFLAAHGGVADTPGG